MQKNLKPIIITGSRVITIIRGWSTTHWKRVTENTLHHANNTLPGYVQKNDTVCLNY